MHKGRLTSKFTETQISKVSKYQLSTRGKVCYLQVGIYTCMKNNLSRDVGHKNSLQSFTYKKISNPNKFVNCSSISTELTI